MDNVGTALEPNPDSVTTIAELGRELRLLKVWMGNPSLRDLAKRARDSGANLPPSSAGDVQSGTRLPRMAAVLTFVRACGVGEADIGSWTSAWRRAALHHKGYLPSDNAHYSPSAPESERSAAGNGGPESGASNSSGNNLLNVRVEPGGVAHFGETGLTAQQLAAMPVQPAADHLEALPPEEAATLLATMELAAAVRRLAAMERSEAASVLSFMDERLAAQRLEQLLPAQAAELLGLMKPKAAAPRLTEIDPGKAGMILTVMTRAIAAALLNEAAALLGEADIARLAASLEAMESSAAASLLADMEPLYAATMLAAMKQPSPARASASQPEAVQEFARALRNMRAKAGNPSIAALAARTETAERTLSDIFRGTRRMPPRWETVEAIVRACDGDTAAWRRDWQRATALAEQEFAAERRRKPQARTRAAEMLKAMDPERASELREILNSEGK